MNGPTTKRQFSIINNRSRRFCTIPASVAGRLVLRTVEGMPAVREGGTPSTRQMRQTKPIHPCFSRLEPLEPANPKCEARNPKQMARPNARNGTKGARQTQFRHVRRAKQSQFAQGRIRANMPKINSLGRNHADFIRMKTKPIQSQSGFASFKFEVSSVKGRRLDTVFPNSHFKLDTCGTHYTKQSQSPAERTARWSVWVSRGAGAEAAQVECFLQFEMGVCRKIRWEKCSRTGCVHWWVCR